MTGTTTVKALGLNALIRDGKTVTVELTPKDAGTFEIDCSEYCGRVTAACVRG